jgi:hypothetical protein
MPPKAERREELMWEVETRRSLLVTNDEGNALRAAVVAAAKGTTSTIFDEVGNAIWQVADDAKDEESDPYSRVVVTFLGQSLDDPRAGASAGPEAR